MTDRSERTFKIPLAFLSSGRFQAEIASDEETAKAGLHIRKEFVTAKDAIELKLSPAGGAYARLTPAP